MDAILQKISEFLIFFSSWLNQHIISGLADFIRLIGELIIRILEFCIDIVKWLISYL